MPSESLLNLAEYDSQDPTMARIKTGSSRKVFSLQRGWELWEVGQLVVLPSNGWLQKWLYQVDSTEWRHEDSWSWKGGDTRTFLDLSSVLGTSSEGTSKTPPLELTLSEAGEGQGPLARASLYLFFKELTYRPDALFIYGSSRIQKTWSEVRVGSDHTGATHCQWLLGY